MGDRQKTRISEILRDSIHNYSAQSVHDLEDDIFFDRLKFFITTVEGCRNEAYLDGIPDPDKKTQYISSKKFYALGQERRDQLEEICFAKYKQLPICTVGIGLNINEEKTQLYYDQLFKEPGLMKKVYYGEKNLTDEQVTLAYKDSIQTRYQEVCNIYGPDWKRLRANEKMTILSLYFNHPELANGKTTFCQLIRNYVKTGKTSYLQGAVREVKERSNVKRDPSLQNRRDAEAALLASYQCPTYTKPTHALSYGIQQAEIGKTRISPQSQGKEAYQWGKNKAYFIWRTKMDKKVRMEHLEREGKVYSRENPPDFLPGEKHHCRCHADPVPDHIVVQDPQAERKHFQLYLKRGSVRAEPFLRGAVR